MTARGRTLAALGALAALTLWTHAPLWSGTRSVLHGDTLLHTLPVHRLHAEMLQETGMRLWLPEVEFGYPLYAEATHALFHPLRILLFGTLPWLLAHDLSFALDAFLTAVFAFALARSASLGRDTSLFVGLLVGGSPGVLQLLYNGAYAQTLPWSVAVLAAFERAEARPSLGRFAMLAVAIGLVALSSYPPLLYATLLYVALLSALRFPFQPGARARRLAGLGLAVAAGFALASVQLLPLAELLTQSVRPGAISMRASVDWRASVMGQVLAAAPFLFTRPVTWSLGLGSVFVLLAALLGPLLRGRVMASHAVAIGVMIALGAGPGNPLFDVARDVLPAFDRLRLTHQFLWVALAPLALVVGALVARVGRALPTPRELAPCALSAAVVTLASAAWIPHLGLTAAYGALGVGLALAALVGAITLHRAQRAAWWPSLCIALLVGETLLARGIGPSFLPNRVLDAIEPVAQRLARARDEIGPFVALRASAHERDPWLQRILFTDPASPGYEDLVRGCLRMLCSSLPLLRDIADGDAHHSLPLARRALVTPLLDAELRGESPRAPGERLIDRLRVRFVAGASDFSDGLTAAGLVATPVADAPSAFGLFENRATRERVQWRETAIRVAGPDEATRRWPEASASLLVEDPPPDPIPATLRRIAVALPFRRLETTGPLTFDAPRAGWAFVPQPFYPGWSAWLDGDEVPLHPADVMGVAVQVPAGRHVLELRFAPAAYALGLTASVATALALLAIAAAATLWSREAAPAS